MKKQFLKSTLALLFAVFLTSFAFAEEPAAPAEVPAEAAPKKQKDLPRSGSLSSSISGIHDSRAIPGPWGGVDVKGETASPITGSVSKISANKWQMRVFNNSEDSYSVSLAVHQYNRVGTKIKSDSFSYSLRPGASAERTLSSLAETEQCTLDLVNWKKTSK